METDLQDTRHQITLALQALSEGADSSDDALLPLVYDELRGIAAARMAGEQCGHTLQTTALVHEAYMRLIGESDLEYDWENRHHFFGAAAIAMRRILIEQARKRAAQKRGGGRKREDWSDIHISGSSLNPTELMALDEALNNLECEDPQSFRIVMLRFFAGLTFEEIAPMMDLSLATVKRRWAFARAWLFAQLNPPENDSG